MPNKTVVVVDCGSSFIRSLLTTISENEFYPIVVPDSTRYVEMIRPLRPKFIIITGSELSVNSKKAPKPDIAILEQEETPVLGICYGMQYMAHILGGEVKNTYLREAGVTPIFFTSHDLKRKEEAPLRKSELFKHFSGGARVWMSHVCTITKLSLDFEVTSISENGLIASIERRNLYGVQFHPEKRLESGRDIGDGSLIFETFFELAIEPQIGA